MPITVGDAGVQLSAVLSGKNGSWTGDSGSAALASYLDYSTWANNYCGGMEYPWFGPSLLIAIDVDPSRDDFYSGGVLTVNSCCSAVDTVILAGTGCPLNPASFACGGGNGGDAALGCVTSPSSFVCPLSSGYTHPPVTDSGVTAGARVSLTLTQPVAYLIVAGANGGSGNITLSWSFGPPSASPSASYLSSGSATGSNAATPSVSPVTASLTASVTRTPVATPSATGTPLCYGAVAFSGFGSGPSGSISATTGSGQGWPASTAYTGATCPDGAGGSLGIPFGRKAVIALDLGPYVDLGGQLDIESCRQPRLDTWIAVSYACPGTDWNVSAATGIRYAVPSASWSCVAAAQESDACGPMAAVSLYPLTSRYVYVIVAGTAGAVGPFTLDWNYSMTRE